MSDRIAPPRNGGGHAPPSKRLAAAFSQERTGVPNDEVTDAAQWNRNVPLHSPPIFEREDNCYRNYNPCKSGPRLPTSPWRAMRFIPLLDIQMLRLPGHFP
jgi:hypothetical protein